MKPYIIAEIGLNANGSRSNALDLIRMAADAGADAVKFQKRTPDIVYSTDIREAPRGSPWGQTQEEQKNGLEFWADDYNVFFSEAERLRIDISASAWDLASLHFIEEFQPKWHKIASPMVTNLQFVDGVAKLKRHAYISTGMSSLEDIDRAVEIFKKRRTKFTLMHCVSLYPCPDELCNLSMVETLFDRYLCPVGYSGHEKGLIPSIVAVMLGACAIERHITLDRSMYGSDQAASLEIDGLRRLVAYCKQGLDCMGDGVKTVLDAERENAKKLRYWENDK